MKHSSMLILTLYLLAGASCPGPGPGPGPAPPPANGVCQAQLYFSDINTTGKALVNGNSLIFIDDQPIAGSSDTFSIDGSNVIDKNQQPGTVSIYTYNMIRYRAKRERYFTFRFTAGDCTSVIKWPYGLTPREQSHTWKRKPPPPLAIFRANHRRTLRPDLSGNLVFWEKSITFGNRRGTMYEWDFRDIEHFNRQGNHVLEIIPFRGNKFTFTLLDSRGITRQHFDELKDRIMAQ